MATYYPIFSYQRENLPTTCLGDQKPGSHHESSSQPGNSIIYLNQASSAGAFSEILSGSSLSLQNCVQIPSGRDRNEMSFIPSSSDTMSLQSVDGELNITTCNSMCNLVTFNPPAIRRSGFDGEPSSQSQGLSLTLGSQISSRVSVPSFQYQYQGYSPFSCHPSFLGKGTISCTGVESRKSKELKTSDDMQCGLLGDNNDAFATDAQGSISHKQIHSDIYHFEPGFANNISNSKYLRVAQELLDEVVNVRKALKQPDLDKNISSQPKMSNGRSSEHSDSVNNSSSEITPAERQDLHNKKTKLLSMQDEVDRRYRQYYHQMKIVVSSFDMVAGCGAAIPYTKVALQTISRHFRCLRDAISGQIHLIQKSLGEKDNSSNKQGEAIPRLRYVDHQLRQQRALQQLGVMRNAWRPQRGLPESSVSILRAWLFEHFLHPYPKDSEKIMLAKQTGLTRNQVANWFINARVRLWKPMIEEMHKEEFGEMDSNLKSSLEDDAKAIKENSSASDERGEELQESMTSKVADANNVQPGQVQHSKHDHIPAPSVEPRMPIASSVFQNIGVGDSTGSPSGIMKLQVDQMSNMKSNNSYPDIVMSPSHHGNGTLMGSDTMYDLTRLGGFAVGDQVSLALGLRHHENNNDFSMSGEANMRGSTGVASSVGSEAVDFHCMEPGNQQEDRFGNPHIFHDFVV